MLAVMAGLFIAGLAYLQYQQLASFDWNRIEVMAGAALGYVAAHISTNLEMLELYWKDLNHGRHSTNIYEKRVPRIF